MGLASLLCLCSTTDAFIAANAFGQFSLASKLGFLLFGPMFDFKLFWLYGMIFKRRVVALLGMGLFCLIAFICWRVSLLDNQLPGNRPPVGTGEANAMVSSLTESPKAPVADKPVASSIKAPLQLDLPQKNP